MPSSMLDSIPADWKAVLKELLILHKYPYTSPSISQKAHEHTTRAYGMRESWHNHGKFFRTCHIKRERSTKSRHSPNIK